MPSSKNTARNTPPSKNTARSISPSKNATGNTSSSKKHKLRGDTKARRKSKDNMLLDLKRAAKEYNPVLREEDKNNSLTPTISFYSYSRRYSRCYSRR